MIVGIGLDTTILSRFTKFVQNKKFIDRILTIGEKIDFESIEEGKRANFLAKRFSGKEAFAKALGIGIGAGFSFKGVEILKTQQNAPYIKILDEKILLKAQSALISFSDELVGGEVLISSVVILQK